MNRWTFVITEVSAGCYRCEAIRDTHHSFSRDGHDAAIAQLLQDAFEMEQRFGTIPGEAAFHVTAGFQKTWLGNYHPEWFGSWNVSSLIEPRKAVYDAKDFHLALYREDGPPVWQGHISSLKEHGCAYFTELSHL